MPDMAREIPIDPLGLSRETMADWVFPYFIRADILALRYQRRFRLAQLAHLRPGRRRPWRSSPCRRISGPG